MSGCTNRSHGQKIGEALRTRFLQRQDLQLLQRMCDLYRAGHTIEQVSKLTGRPFATVARWLKNAGVCMRPAFGDRHRAWSAARRAATPAKPVAPRPKDAAGNELRGYDLLCHRTLGNRSLSSQGYVVVNTGRRQRRYEHDLVAEAALGRPLRPGEVVHHINCVRADNRPSNLLVCTHEYHLALHARMRRDPYWRQVIEDAKALNSRKALPQ